MIARLIRIYTPFICALAAIVHGVLFLQEYEGNAIYVFSDLTGHSIVMVAYILATSKRMCRWYKYTCYLLLIMHFLNLAYVAFDIDYYILLYAGLVINIFALITFLIYRIKVGITKILC